MNRMKYVALGLITTLFLAACGDDDEDGQINPENERIANEVNAVAIEGTWEIVRFLDDDENETSDYAGYTFTFAPDGSLSATDGSNTITGTWSVVADDDDEIDVDFNIAFTSPETFAELTDDWDVISFTDTRIELGDDDIDDGDDFLTFEKTN